MKSEFDSFEKKQFRVVAALIIKDGKVLLTQRWPGKNLGLTWEFPGGKVEDNETDKEALERELKEELGITANIGSCCFETRHGYGAREVHLLIFRCKLTSGEPKALDVKDMDWVDIAELKDRKFPPADLLFVQELTAGRIKYEVEEHAYHDENDDDDDDDSFEEFQPAQVVRKPTK